MAWRPSAKAVRSSPAVRPAASVPRRAARAATSGGVKVFIQSLSRCWAQTEALAPTPIPMTIHRTRFSTPISTLSPAVLAPAVLLAGGPSARLRPPPQAAAHPADAVADRQHLDHRVGEGH